MDVAEAAIGHRDATAHPTAFCRPHRAAAPSVRHDTQEESVIDRDDDELLEVAQRGVTRRSRYLQWGESKGKEGQRHEAEPRRAPRTTSHGSSSVSVELGRPA